MEEEKAANVFNAFFVMMQELTAFHAQAHTPIKNEIRQLTISNERIPKTSVCLKDFCKQVCRKFKHHQRIKR